MTESQTPPLPEQNPSSEPASGAPEHPAAPQVPPRPPAPDGGREQSPAAPEHGRAPHEDPARGVPAQPDFPPAGDPIAAPESLDQETYTALREPRGGGLQLDGAWHQISPKYVVSQIVQSVALIVLVAAAALVVSLLSGQPWVWIVAGVIVLIQIIALIILPRQARALGYMLRADDLVFRRGILWQRMVAVPYGRMQLIDITHGPLDRMFGIAKLKMVTAAASTGVEIPGLTDAAAEALRDTLIDVAETRRTGL